LIDVVEELAHCVFQTQCEESECAWLTPRVSRDCSLSRQPPTAANVIRRLAAAQDALWRQEPQLPQACV